MDQPAAGNPRAVSIRIQSNGAGRSGGQRKHDLRHAPIPGYVDKNRTPLNSVIVQPMIPRALRKVCQTRRNLRKTKRAMKSNASVSITGIIVFGREVQADFQALSISEQNNAYLDVAEAIAARLNTNLTGLVAHRDETAPHAHFQFPAYDLAGNAVSSMTKRRVTAELQTIAAEAMKRHVASAERGHSKYDRLRSGAEFVDTVHRSVAKLHHDLGPEIANARSMRTKLENENTILKKRIAALHEKEQRTSKEVKRLQTYERRLAKKRDELTELEIKAAHLETAANRSRASQSAAEARRDALEAEVAQAREDALTEAEEAADAILARARSLEETFLSDGTKALLQMEQERDQWRGAFELLRSILRKVIPENRFEAIRAQFVDLWDRDPNNPDRKSEISHNYSSHRPPRP